jgi:hypothetical protein
MKFLFEKVYKTMFFVSICAAVMYVMTLAVLVAVYYAPWSLLKGMNEEKAGNLMSLGVFSPEAHPLYSKSLRGFLRQPDTRGSAKYLADTYKAYGSNVFLDVDDQDNDCLGFPNSAAMHEASVLFVGDSFGLGTSAGSKHAPSAIYSAVTNVAAYNASNGSWGPAQYVGIIKMLTTELPAGRRFKGNDVVVTFYLGNDFDFDVIQYLLKRIHTDHAMSWLVKLGPIRSWISYIKLTLSRQDETSGADAYYFMSSMAAVSAAKFLQQVASSAYAGVRDNNDAPLGLYSPVPMNCDTVEGLPFAWHPGNASLIQSGVAPEIWNTTEGLISELKSLESDGRRIKIVLIPANIQILYDSIDWSSVRSGSRIATDTIKLKEIMDQTREKAKWLFGKYKFEVLDLTDLMSEYPGKCLFYQPFDTHCTAAGYAFIGKAIADKWPDLGKF